MLFSRKHTPIGASVIRMRGMGDDGYGDSSVGVEQDENGSTVIFQPGTTARSNVRVNTKNAARQRQIQQALAIRAAQQRAANERAAKLAAIQKSLDEQARRYQELEDAAARIQARQDAARAAAQQKRQAPQISVQDREEVTLPSRSSYAASDPVKDYLPDTDVDTWLNPSKGIDRTFGLPDFSTIFNPPFGREKDTKYTTEGGGYDLQERSMIESPPPSPPAIIARDDAWQRRSDAIQKALSYSAPSMEYAATSPVGTEQPYAQPVAVAKPAPVYAPASVPAPVSAFLDVISIPTPKSFLVEYEIPMRDGSVQMGHGTASAISDNMVVTAQHVIRSGGKLQNVFVTIGGKRYYVDVVKEGSYPDMDLSILKIHDPKVRLTPQKIADEDVKIGDRVIFDGFPLGVHKITSGPVTEKAGSGDFMAEAPFTHGNSGGPVYNQAGDIVGIASRAPAGNEMGMTGKHGIFIPISKVKEFLGR